MYSVIPAFRTRTLVVSVSTYYTALWLCLLLGKEVDLLESGSESSCSPLTRGLNTEAVRPTTGWPGRIFSFPFSFSPLTWFADSTTLRSLVHLPRPCFNSAFERVRIRSAPRRLPSLPPDCTRSTLLTQLTTSLASTGLDLVAHLAAAPGALSSRWCTCAPSLSVRGFVADISLY